MHQSNISRLWARIQNVLLVARATLVSDGGPFQKLQVRTSSLQIVDDLPNLAHYGFQSNPPIGTDAVVVNSAGDSNGGVVIATNNQIYRMKALASGEVAISDNANQVVYLSDTGIRVVSPLGVLVDTPTAHFTGNVQIDGDATAHNVTAVADVKDQNGAKSMAGMRGAFNSHIHADPQGGITGGPSPGM